jgi:2'-5' RNA ligase
MRAPLRLIAILPPETLSAYVRAEQQRIAETWGPRHALRTPPHITVIPPIEIGDDRIGTLEEIAAQLAPAHATFTLRLRGFGAFAPNVLYIRPVRNIELDELHRDWRRRLEETLPGVLARYPDKPYRPHLTLAHRDVAEAQFHAMWAHYGEKRLDISFKVKSFAILDHSRSGWSVRREFTLGRAGLADPTVSGGEEAL